MKSSDMMTAAGMGAMAGMRVLSAPPFMSQQMAEGGVASQATPVEEILASTPVARALPLLAFGEFILDKLPGMPPRLGTPGLLVRGVSGAMVGVAVARHKKVSAVGLALVGAAASLVSSFALYKARQFATERLHIPNIIAGFLEDALVTTAGMRLAAVMR
jgi:uncharacterized membrane protein